MIWAKIVGDLGQIRNNFGHRFRPKILNLGSWIRDILLRKSLASGQWPSFDSTCTRHCGGEIDSDSFNNHRCRAARVSQERSVAVDKQWLLDTCRYMQDTLHRTATLIHLQSLSYVVCNI